MPVEKRIGRLYGGNLLRKALSEKIFDAEDQYQTGKRQLRRGDREMMRELKIKGVER